jgi:UDP-N-acetylmuramate dehydrogenase
MSEITYNLPKVEGTYRFNVDLSRTNWFRVGGKAQVLFLPKRPGDLGHFLLNKPKDLPINILGVGSNVIVRDGGVEGVVIKLGGGFTNISNKGNLVTIGASCLCYNVALYSKVNGIAGLEFLAGVPGSIGGAIRMNAGCYNADIGSVLVSATAIDFDGKVHYFQNEDFGFKYRGNSLPKNLIFVEGVFKVVQSTPELVGKKIAEFNRKRESTQPIRSKTGGSTFKNPPCDKRAWQLIDEAGCRGMIVGGAMISKQHCNFMINTGSATAKDLIDLGNKVIDKVKEKTGITLEWEIKIIGKD